MEISATSQNRRLNSHEFFRQLLKLAGAGGAAFWITDFIMSVSPIADSYKAVFSISYLPTALIEALLGGLIIASGVSYFLLRFFEKIPTKRSIFTALILSLGAMAIIQGIATLANPTSTSATFLIETSMNLPRFLALGLAVGYRHKTLKGEAGK